LSILKYKKTRILLTRILVQEERRVSKLMPKQNKKRKE